MSNMSQDVTISRDAAKRARKQDPQQLSQDDRTFRTEESKGDLKPQISRSSQLRDQNGRFVATQTKIDQMLGPRLSNGYSVERNDGNDT